jgi:hypothetical protein
MTLSGWMILKIRQKLLHPRNARTALVPTYLLHLVPIFIPLHQLQTATFPGLHNLTSHEFDIRCQNAGL